MFSREITNDYGSYSKQGEQTVLLKGVFDSNFIELAVINPTIPAYKVFDSETINFGVVVGNSTYIPSHLFNQLKTAFEEGNPYFTPTDLITIELNLVNTLNYITQKYYTQNIASKVDYKGFGRVEKLTNTNTSTATITTVSGSTNVSQPATITLNTPTERKVVDVQGNFTSTFKSRLEVAGVNDISYQFFIDNNTDTPNDNSIIEYIRYMFEEVDSVRPKGSFIIQQYELPNGEVIQANLPIETKLVEPVTNRVTNVDDYLRDVIRDAQTQ
jgi:hypothetical protein